MWLLGAVFATALALRLQGINWPKFHPDEHPIGDWIAKGEPGRVYPGGFFVMIRPARAAWEAWEGLVHRVACFRGLTDRQTPPPPDYILMGRLFNAWIGALTCLFVYLAASNIAGSKNAGLAGAALFAFAQYHVEHCHYAETDIAMVFALAVALWLWTQFIRSHRAPWFVAAALAAGFAAGTKFTLVVLLPPLLVYCLVHGFTAAPRRRFARATGFLLAGLLLFAAGFVIATPEVTDWSEFAAGLAHEKARVYQETAANMGILAGDTQVRLAARVSDLFNWSLSLGYGWLALWLISLPCVFLREFRRYWIPAVLAPLFYTVYWIFQSPWVRTQEFLNYLPFAAAVAPLAVLIVWRTGRAPARALAALALLVALVGGAIRGMQVASIFGWKDTRLLAGRWLQRHEPDAAVFAREKYADAPVLGRSIPVGMVARFGLAWLREQGADFAIRNGAAGGRGMIHPVTGLRYPHFEAVYQEFLAGSEHLCNWSLLPPAETLTTFNSIHLDLYGLRRNATRPSFDGVLPQHALVSREGRETFFPVGRHLGSATALLVDKHGVTCAVGGPGALRRPVYAILYTRERPAEIHLKGFGRRARVRLAPYDAAVVPLSRPWWAPRLGHVEKIAARATPVENITYIPCYLRVAFSEEEAAYVLDEMGYRHTLRRAPDLAPEDLRQFRQMEDTAFAYRGVSAWYYNRFARLRLPADELNGLSVTLYPTGESPASGFEGVFELPVERAASLFKLRFETAIEPLRGAEGPDADIVFVEAASGATLGGLRLGTANGEYYTGCELMIPPGHAGPLRILVRAPDAMTVRFRNVELEWDINDALDGEIARVAIARATRELAAERPNEALHALAPVIGDPAYELVRKRLTLEAMRASPDASESQRVEAAETLLDAAPDHYDALETLADAGRANAAARAVRLTPLSGRETAFGPFLRVIGFSWDEASRVASCIVEVTRDNPPPLALRLLARRRGRWKPLEKRAICERKVIAAGERFAIEIPLNYDKADASDLRSLALAVESDVRWHPGRLPVEGNADGVVTFSELVEP